MITQISLHSWVRRGQARVPGTGVMLYVCFLSFNSIPLLQMRKQPQGS